MLLPPRGETRAWNKYPGCCPGLLFNKCGNLTTSTLKKMKKQTYIRVTVLLCYCVTVLLCYLQTLDKFSYSNCFKPCKLGPFFLQELSVFCISDEKVFHQYSRAESMIENVEISLFISCIQVRAHFPSSSFKKGANRRSHTVRKTRPSCNLRNINFHTACRVGESSIAMDAYKKTSFISLLRNLLQNATVFKGLCWQIYNILKYQKKLKLKQIKKR